MSSSQWEHTESNKDALMQSQPPSYVKLIIHNFQGEDELFVNTNINMCH